MSDMSAAAMSVAQAPIRAPAATASVARAQTAAKEFEGVFITQMLGQMFSGIETDKTFGGGQGETMFRSLMLDQYGKQISAQGGIGLASTITAQLLKHQEVSLPDQKAQTQAGDADVAKTNTTQHLTATGSAP